MPYGSQGLDLYSNAIRRDRGLAHELPRRAQECT